MTVKLSPSETHWLELESARLEVADADKREQLAKAQAELEAVMIDQPGEPQSSDEPDLGGAPFNIARPGHSPKFIIVGAGVGGMALGVRLRQAGYDDFVILEKGDDIGGTWHHNKYPGIACDVVPYAYSFTFFPNPHWSEPSAPGSEIQDYLRNLADHFRLVEKIRFNSHVDSCVYRDGQWNVSLAGGETMAADILLLASGFLHIPNIPSFEGQDRFRGQILHSTQVHGDESVRDKRVAVIGNGSSAVQIVSNIPGLATDVNVFQRTAQWILPGDPEPYSERRRKMLEKHPRLLRALYEYHAAALGNSYGVAAVRESEWRQIFVDLTQAYLDTVVDPELRAKLTPDYPVLCKRLVISASFYGAIQLPNVHLITDGIAGFEEKGIRTLDGKLHEVDTIILATGFDTQAFFRRLNISVEGGPTVDDAWIDGARSSDTVALAGFPNLFFVGGPFTTIGNLPLMRAYEFQSGHIMRLIAAMQEGGFKSIMPSKAREEAFMALMRGREGATAWLRDSCSSWYIDANGHVSIWTGTPDEFTAHLLEGPDLKHYTVSAV